MVVWDATAHPFTILNNKSPEAIMTSYNNFIGIDIGKFSFVVFTYKSNSIDEYENNGEGITQFIEEYSNIMQNSLCIIEATGGYEMELLYSLVDSGYDAHRADSRKVKSFIRSLGTMAKTDALDAKALARYGYERHQILDLFELPSQEYRELFQLIQRRSSLKSTLVAEKNRLKSPCNEFINNSIAELINVINGHIDIVTARIAEIIENNPTLKKKQEILKTMPGVGAIVSFELLILMPELGSICRRKAASLAGVAPRSNESGRYFGYRRTGHGRDGVKPMLFVAAMAARNSNTEFKVFYEKLIKKGKAKKVALTAIMRKIIVVANAKIRDLDI